MVSHWGMRINDMKNAKVKICGITNPEDALKACEGGADLLGFIFIAGTPRYVYADKVNSIMNDFPDTIYRNVQKVGLFKDEKPGKIETAIKEAHLNAVQLHGKENPAYCSKIKEYFGNRVEVFKVFKVKDSIMPCGEYMPSDYKDVDFFVFDTYHPEMDGGTGEKYDWSILANAKEKIDKPFFVAGGLNPGNVKEAIETIQPYGVDVSSGIEARPGEKDDKLLKEFIENAKDVQIT